MHWRPQRVPGPTILGEMGYQALEEFVLAWVQHGRFSSMCVSFPGSLQSMSLAELFKGMIYGLMRGWRRLGKVHGWKGRIDSASLGWPGALCDWRFLLGTHLKDSLLSQCPSGLCTPLPWGPQGTAVVSPASQGWQVGQGHWVRGAGS